MISVSLILILVTLILVSIVWITIVRTIIMMITVLLFELLKNEYRSFLKTIVFIKTICDRFLYDCFKKEFLLKIILTIVNEGSSLTIVNETTNFIKTVFFWKKNYMQLFWMANGYFFTRCQMKQPKFWNIFQMGFLYSDKCLKFVSISTNPKILILSPSFYKAPDTKFPRNLRKN